MILREHSIVTYMAPRARILYRVGPAGVGIYGRSHMIGWGKWSEFRSLLKGVQSSPMTLLKGFQPQNGCASIVFEHGKGV